MASTDQQLVDELESRIRTLTLADAVRLVETHHTDQPTGVERGVMSSYLDAIAYGTDAFPTSFEDALTDARSWQGDGHIYELGDGRVSAYPPRWHDHLDDTTDLREYLRVLGAAVGTTKGDENETIVHDGVQEKMLLNVAAAIGGVETEHARNRLKELRDEGELKAYPSQHPNPWLQLS
ncbi:hypothetical protein [Haladaptatus sp. NG-SE-30]